MSDVFPVSIYHNPSCGTSRNTLAMIKAAGYEPQVVEYLKDGWTAPQIKAFLAAMKTSARALMREKGTPAEALGLTKQDVSEAAIVDAMVLHPILVNRPIVVTPLGTVLARPSERVFEVLERCVPEFVKEDGEVVRPARGRPGTGA